MRKVKLAPSILTADFSCLGENIKAALRGGCDYIHIDVCDGTFVPTISFGTPIVSSLRPLTDAVFDVHLMVNKPTHIIEQFALAGADIINVHLEAFSNGEQVREAIDLIKKLNKRPALTLKPQTSIRRVYPYLDELDMVLLMSVEPGYGGQPFMDDMLWKCECLATYIKNKGYSTEIEMDGGINISNIKRIVDAGASVIVTGSAIFNQDDIEGSTRKIINTLEGLN